jgi:hypothetical protein
VARGRRCARIAASYVTVIIANNTNVDYHVDEISPPVYKLACVPSRGRDKIKIEKRNFRRRALQILPSGCASDSAVHFCFARVAFQK